MLTKGDAVARRLTEGARHAVPGSSGTRAADGRRGGAAHLVADAWPTTSGSAVGEARAARKRLALAVVLALGLLGSLVAAGGWELAWADGTGTASPREARAGLVVRFEDGSLVERCVVLDAPERSGADLLTLAQLDPVFEHGSLGTSVCAIAGRGCQYPAEPCWCRCQQPDTDCQYWAYFVLEAGQWKYATTGAGDRIVRDGDVDGWAWTGGGATPAMEPLPARTFAELCGSQIPAPLAGRQGFAPAGRSIRAVGIGVALLAVAGAAVLGRRQAARRRRRRPTS